jgi:phosphoglycerol transferase MdoB-like AlkP superfamily enzyme
VAEVTTERSWGRRSRPLAAGAAATLALALVCNLTLEVSRVVGTGTSPWRDKSPAFLGLFLLGTLVVWLVVGALQALLGRLWITVVLALSVTGFVAITDREKVRVRQEPLYPTDWEFTGDLGALTEMVGLRGIVVPAIVVLVLTVAVFAAAKATARRLRRHGYRTGERRTGRVVVVRRLVTGTVCVAALVYLGNFNQPGNAGKAAYDALGATWRPWGQQANYLHNGFVGGFLYNLDVPPVPPPAGYSAAEMARVVETYRASAARINEDRRAGAVTDVNVLLLLDESFSDPTTLAGVDVAEDPMPYVRQVMGRTTSGQMLAPSIGGGTANMEFEALTGMSLTQFPPQLRVPYLKLVPEYRDFPSAVAWFEEQGHRTVAIHPYTTELYRRVDVYRTLGFDEFVYDEKMRHQERLGNDGYISDAAAFDEVLDFLERERAPLFVNLVTMQNHMPYPGRYDDPVAVTGPDGEELADMGHYVRGLEHTDDAVRELLADLEELDEPTVVLFYGDHLPGAYPASVIDANDARSLHETPFFLWSNVPGGPVRPQPTTSPAHAVDLVLEQVGAAVPPYYALLQELRAELPAMAGGLAFDGEGRRTRPAELSARAEQLLHDYRLVQYDLSVGGRYSAEAMFAPAPVRSVSTADAARRPETRAPWIELVSR